MNENIVSKASVVDLDKLPERFPTHRHDPEFWESLGRTIATFGFLEEILGKAIFALTATRQYAAADIEAEFKKWLPILECALSGTLGYLVDSYEKAALNYPGAKIDGLKEVTDELRKASKIRNVLCHGSWGFQMIKVDRFHYLSRRRWMFF